MSELPATITVNVGNPAADVVYTKHEGPKGQVLYMAPSPQGDLTGRPIIEIEYKDGKNDLAHANVKLRTPHYNGATSDYDGHAQVGFPVIRPGHFETQFTRDCCETMCEFIPQIYDNIAQNLP